MTGLPPSESGIRDNSWISPKNTSSSSLTGGAVCSVYGPGVLPRPLWDIAFSQDESFTAFTATDWDWFEQFTNNRSFLEARNCPENDDECVFKETISFLKKEISRFNFVYFGSIDEAGHAHSWGSAKYYSALKKVDEKIGKIVDLLPPKTLVLVTSDHGGEGWGHGAFDEANLDAFLIIWSSEMNPLSTMKGLEFPGSNIRIAPTILSALGLKSGPFMSGVAYQLEKPGNFSLNDHTVLKIL